MIPAGLPNREMSPPCHVFPGRATAPEVSQLELKEALWHPRGTGELLPFSGARETEDRAPTLRPPVWFFLELDNPATCYVIKKSERTYFNLYPLKPNVCLSYRTAPNLPLAELAKIAVLGSIKS